YEDGEKVYDLMKDVLTYVDGPDIVLETIISRQTYLSVKHPRKEISKPNNSKPSVKLYKNYRKFTRGAFIERIFESPQERRL
ncbi:hypothetical protein J3Q64DRAFT_1616914, partial [Phycomyces blakesleeanus]